MWCNKVLGFLIWKKGGEKIFFKTSLKKRTRIGNNPSSTEHVSIFPDEPAGSHEVSKFVWTLPSRCDHPISSFVICISNKSHMQSPSGRHIICWWGHLCMKGNRQSLNCSLSESGDYIFVQELAVVIWDTWRQIHATFSPRLLVYL